MMTNPPRPEGLLKPASIDNAAVYLEMLRRAGCRLSLDAAGELVVDPPPAHADAQRALDRFRAGLVALLKGEAVIAAHTGDRREAR